MKQVAPELDAALCSCLLLIRQPDELSEERDGAVLLFHSNHWPFFAPPAACLTFCLLLRPAGLEAVAAIPKLLCWISFYEDLGGVANLN